MDTFFCPLPGLTLLRISGEDKIPFLQSILSNDIRSVTVDHPVFAALLTPQGKILNDMMIHERDGDLWIETNTTSSFEFLRKLKSYQLRAKIEIENKSQEFCVWAGWGSMPPDGARKDPRSEHLGFRLILPKGSAPNGNITSAHDYDLRRICLGIAEGHKELGAGILTMAEANFDLLNGINWQKGCFVGQEVTARIKYRGLTKRRIFPVKIPKNDLCPDTVISCDDFSIITQNQGLGLAIIRVETALLAAREEKPLTHGEISIYPFIPPWMKIDERQT